MKELKVKHLTIYKNDYKPEIKYRKELSELLIKEFGEGPYSNQELVREAISFCYNYYCDKFIDLCKNEKSLRFYQLILSQHEQATEVALFANDEDFPDGLSRDYISIYRRVLKWILEQACDVMLVNDEKIDDKFLERAKNKLNELYFVGDMIFFCANIYAEQDMIEDVAEIIFDDSKQYIVRHKHHYNYVIEKIKESFNTISFKHVVDENAIQDLITELNHCFGVKYEYLTTVIHEIHKLNKDKGGQYCPFGWESLPLSVESMFGANVDQARLLFKGLTLSRDNKLKLHDLACKPHTLFRYIYRPILIWNVEGEDFAIIGINGFKESIMQLTTNCIPWGKAPIEWLSNNSFQEYVHSKEDLHDKWFDDDLEKRLIDANFHYHKYVTSLKTSNGSISLNIPSVGEIDFIIIDHDNRKIYIADCKHLQGRYDMMSQKNDFSNFVKVGKGYNNQIKNKLDFIETKRTELNYHYKETYGNNNPDIDSYTIEGIFIINTPTFYMFNSDYRIYTINVIVDILKRNLIDPELTVIIESEESTQVLNIKYPYFKKPDYTLIDILETEE